MYLWLHWGIILLLSTKRVIAKLYYANVTTVSCFSKRFQSLTGQENLTAALAASNGAPAPAPADLDALKQEILVEMRREIQKAKQDIIDGNLQHPSDRNKCSLWLILRGGRKSVLRP